MLYSGAQLKRIRFPLGGIGAGSVSLTGEGRFADWEMWNRPAKGSRNGFTHFAVKAARNGRTIDARVLQGDMQDQFEGQYGADYGFGPSSASMGGFPHFREVVFEGTFPTARLTFSEPRFPGRAALDAWSPFVPLKADESSVPAAVFTLSIENTTQDPLDYTFVFAAANPSDKGCRNEAIPGGLRLTDALHGTEDTEYRELAVLADEADPLRQLYWFRGSWFDAPGIYWRELTADAPLPPRTYPEPDPKRGHECAAVAVTRHAAPGETVRATFILAWYAPLRRNDWSPREGEQPWRNWYATRWNSAADAASWLLENREALEKGTYAFRDALHDSNLPPEVIDAASANLAVLRSPVSLRLEDGTFYGWEGVAQGRGSCEGTCTHVWSYAYALCYLFPSLERSIREADYRYNLEDSGYMTFRLPLPLGRKNPHFHACVDGQMLGIVKTLREWRLSGDDAWLSKLWPSVKKALAFAWSPENPDAWDADGDGILEGRQHHTLDMELFGPSSWLQGLYLAALRAGAVMARAMGDAEFAGTCDRLFENGSKFMESALFNGKWYFQRVDLQDKATLDRFGCAASYWNDETGEMKYQIGEGSIIDQMLGQYHAALCGLGDIFDPAHRKTALKTMVESNFKPTLREFYNPCRLFALDDEAGTVICDYPEGAYKPAVPIPYCEECMTGFEYAFAALLLSEGMLPEGLAAVRAIRDLYTGERRNPWSEIECGANYARTMASFALLPILEGLTVDLPAGRIGVSPRMAGDLRAFFSCGTAWGTLAVNGSAVTLTLLGGTLALSSFACPGTVTAVEADGTPLAFEKAEDGARFETVTVREKLVITRK